MHPQIEENEHQRKRRSHSSEDDAVVGIAAVGATAVGAAVEGAAIVRAARVWASLRCSAANFWTVEDETVPMALRGEGGTGEGGRQGEREAGRETVRSIRQCYFADGTACNANEMVNMPKNVCLKETWGNGIS